MSKSKHYFEGVIEYDIKYDIYTEQITQDELNAKEGVKMVLLFRKGEWLRKYYNTEGELISERFLDLKEKKGYHWHKYGEKIKWFDITKDESPTTYSTIGEDHHMGYDCIKFRTISQNPGYILTAHFSYAKDLHTNPNWYTDYKDASFNEIAAEVENTIYLKLITETDFLVGTYTATKITHRKIKNKEIKFDKTRLPLKEF